jgi:16S rRNA (cytosine967-C5)-methyltransferase
MPFRQQYFSRETWCSTMVDPARKTACSILDDLAVTQVTLDGLLERYRPTIDRMPRRDRALLQQIVYGVLRWRKRLDATIAGVSRTPLHKIQPPILTVLRAGAYQILYLDRIPDSAAVNTAVEIAKKRAPQWVTRYVNGVLRTVARGQERPLPMPEDPLEAMALQHSFPRWMVRRWCGRFGDAETEALCEAMNRIPPITLRVNTLKTDRSRLRRALEQQAGSVEEAGRLPQALYLRRPEGAIHSLATFQRGEFQVQDEATQAVAALLAACPGESVLDACAGRGGKTAHIAQSMGNRGNIVAVDISGGKLRQLEEEMRRMGIAIVETRQCDMTQPPQAWKQRFDRILLDAPCSGMGVIRRNPDTKWRVTEELVQQCGRRQGNLLNGVAPLVKKGGRICFAVCSFETEETDAVIDGFLRRTTDFDIEYTPLEPAKRPLLVQEIAGDTGVLRAFPHRHDTDGFYCACLRRKKS